MMYFSRVYHRILGISMLLETQQFPMAGEYTFVTKPPATADINVLVLGDVATTINTKAVLASTIKAHYTLALVAGDLSYANGDNTTWDTYFDLLQPQAANTMWMNAIGNHEAGKDDYYGIPYLNRVIQPNNELWYGINYGPVHLLFFSTEHPTGNTTEQYQFIQQDLAAANANRANVPFVITVAHKPIYTSNLSHGPETTVRANIEPLLIKYGVDIGIWGHNHCYERSYPMQNSTPNNTRTGSASQPYDSPQAPIYVTVGTGGKDLYTTWTQPQPAWSYYRQATYGFATFSVVSNVLHWQFFALNGSIADEFYIQKS